MVGRDLRLEHLTVKKEPSVAQLLFEASHFVQTGKEDAATNGRRPGEDLYDMEDLDGMDKAAAADIEMGSMKTNGGHERTNGHASTSADRDADASADAAGRKRGLASRLPAGEAKPWKSLGERVFLSASSKTLSLE